MAQRENGRGSIYQVCYSGRAVIQPVSLPALIWIARVPLAVVKILLVFSLEMATQELSQGLPYQQELE